MLGICYGLQLMAHELGGEVVPSPKREYGPATVSLTTSEALFAGIEREQPVWMSHGDSILRPPEGFRATAQTDSTPFAGLADEGRNLYGIQFHPEVVHTPVGRDVLRNFVVGIAGLRPTWTPANLVETTVAEIRERVGDGHVICALSGGVDSAGGGDARAPGHRRPADLHLRRPRPHAQARVGAAARHVRASTSACASSWSTRASGSCAAWPASRTRRRSGGSSATSSSASSRRRPRSSGQIDFLTQGTLYPDVIESTTAETKTAQKIKTHHNVGGLPADLRFQLIEPLRYLFKDEVRAVGVELGLPGGDGPAPAVPGPGLAIRIIGEVTAERLDTLREADWIVIDEIKAAGLYRSLWQCFAILTPVRSVGVMGDGRTYANVVAVRAVTSDDGMTADWARLPYEVLAKISSRIVNEVPGVNRVVYDISSKPPATIEWE